MNIIEGNALSNLCDYSFGDHLGCNGSSELAGGFAKPANISNQEFLVKAQGFKGKVMTLFIDNIRLYSRSLDVDTKDADYVSYLLSTNDLLLLCAELPNNKFIIFTSHEDTPIDDKIKIPDNVLGIHAVNAAYFGGKIHPFPYGVQRKINRKGGPVDNRIEILKEEIGKEIEPTKLLYINCGIARNPTRQDLRDFEGLDWVTTRFNEDSMYFPYDKYGEFLDELRQHKFIVCPEGHGMDCHRNWETLYMRRVPIMKKSPYFTCLMKDFPVLFVDEWSDITPELLKNSTLFHEAQAMNLNKLDLNVMFEQIVKPYEVE